MAKAAATKPKTARPRQRRSRENYILTYYQAIQSGTITVGKWIALLYAKIVKAIEDKQLIYDAAKAYECIDYIEEHCYHVEGPLAPACLKLELWQKAFLSCAFGLLDPETKLPNWREIVLIVGRKNGKSALASALCKFCFDHQSRQAGGYGSRIYCIAPKLDQADIVYNNLWQMCVLDGSTEETKKDPSIPRHRMTDLYLEKTNSTVKKLAFSSRRSDGFSPNLCVADEVSSWPGENGIRQFEVMKSGMGARPTGFMFACSTSGYENDGIFDELMKRSTRYLLGESEEKRLLPAIYMIDDIEKWDNINELQKSCPNLGVSLSVDFLLNEIAVAKSSYSRKTEFICKMCNVKQNSSTAWLSSQDVDAICGEPLRLEDFRNCYCVGGVDLSQTIDLTCATAVIEKDGVLNVFAQFFMPRGKIDEAIQREGVPYNAYVKRGLLTLSGDNYIDYADVTKWYVDLVEKYHIYPLKVGYDRYSAVYYVNEMKQHLFHMDDVWQGEQLYPILLDLQGKIEDGTINIGDNDLLKAHLLNSAIKMSVERGRGRLVKLKASLHIDGVAALVDAMTVRSKYYAEIGAQLRNERRQKKDGSV